MRLGKTLWRWARLGRGLGLGPGRVGLATWARWADRPGPLPSENLILFLIYTPTLCSTPPHPAALYSSRAAPFSFSSIPDFCMSSLYMPLGFVHAVSCFLFFTMETLLELWRSAAVWHTREGLQNPLHLVSLILNCPHLTFLFAFLCALSKLGVEQSALLFPESKCTFTKIIILQHLF